MSYELERRANKKVLIYLFKSTNIIKKAGITQLEECKLPKLDAAGSIPVARSISFT